MSAQLYIDADILLARCVAYSPGAPPAWTQIMNMVVTGGGAEGVIVRSLRTGWLPADAIATPFSAGRQWQCRQTHSIGIDSMATSSQARPRGLCSEYDAHRVHPLSVCVTRAE